MLMSARNDFHCENRRLSYSSRCISAIYLPLCNLLNFLLTDQMALSFNMKILTLCILLQDQTMPRMLWQERKAFLSQQTYSQLLLNMYYPVSIFLLLIIIIIIITCKGYINTDHLYLVCKHKHMLKSGAPTNTFGTLYYLLTAESISFVLSLSCSNFLKTVGLWVPLTHSLIKHYKKNINF